MKRLILLLSVLLGMTSAFPATDYYCTGCQGKLLRTDTFCPKCGAKISFANADRQNSSGYSSSSAGSGSYSRPYSSKYPDVYFSLDFSTPLSLLFPFDAYGDAKGGRLKGLALGLLGTYYGMTGVQVEVFNVSLGKMMGLQLGYANWSDSDVYGVQVGFINSAKMLHGVQIGFLNFNERGSVSFFPVINIGW